MCFTLQRQFSSDVKEIIKLAREIALDLGCNYVSTIHFFIADCRLNKFGSIKVFAFNDDIEFSDFYEGNRIAEPIIDDSRSLPLTKEAEKVIRESSIECFTYTDKITQPHHIFMAAANIKDSIFCKSFSNETNLYNKLVSYYANLQLINPLEQKGILLKNIQRFMFYFLKL